MKVHRTLCVNSDYVTEREITAFTCVLLCGWWRPLQHTHTQVRITYSSEVKINPV